MRELSPLLAATLVGALALHGCDDPVSGPGPDATPQDVAGLDTAEQDATQDARDDASDGVTATDGDVDGETPDALPPAARLHEVLLLDPASVEFDAPEPILAVLDISEFSPERDLPLLAVSAPDLSLATPVSVAADVVCPPSMTCLWVELEPATAPGLATLSFSLGNDTVSFPLGLRRPAASISVDRVEPLPLPDLGDIGATFAVDLDGDGVDEIVALSTPDAPLPNGAVARRPVWSVVAGVEDPTASHPAGLRFESEGSWPAADVVGAQGPVTLLDVGVASAAAGTGGRHHFLFNREAAPVQGGTEPGFVVGTDTITPDGVTTRVLARGTANDRLLGLVDGEEGPRGAVLTRDCCGGERDIVIVWPEESGRAALSLGLSDSLEEAVIEGIAAISAAVSVQRDPATGAEREFLTVALAVPASVQTDHDNVCGLADHFRVIQLPGLLQAGSWVRMPPSCTALPRLTQRIDALGPSAVHARMVPPDRFDTTDTTGAAVAIHLSGLGAVVTRADGSTASVYEIHGTRGELGAGASETLFEGLTTIPTGRPFQWNMVRGMNHHPDGIAPVVCDQLDLQVADDRLGNVVMRLPGPACGMPNGPIPLATRPVGPYQDKTVEYDENFRVSSPGGVCGHYTQMVWASTSRVGCGVRPAAEVPVGAGSTLDGGLRIRGGLAHHEPPPTADTPFDGLLSPHGGDMFGYRVTKVSNGGALLVAELGGQPVLEPAPSGTAIAGPRITAGPPRTYLVHIDGDGEFIGAAPIDGAQVHVEAGPGGDDQPDAWITYRPMESDRGVVANAWSLGAVRLGRESNDDVTIVLFPEFARVVPPEGWDDAGEVDVVAIGPSSILLSRRHAVEGREVLSLAVLTATASAAPRVVDIPLPTSASSSAGDLQGTVTIIMPISTDVERPVVIVTGTGAVGASAVALRFDATAFATAPSADLLEVAEIAAPAGVGLVPFRTVRDARGEAAVLVAMVDGQGVLRGGGQLPNIITEPQWSSLALVPSRGLNHWGDRFEGQRALGVLQGVGVVDLNEDGLTDLILGADGALGTQETAWPHLLPGIGAGNLGEMAALGAAWHGALLPLAEAPLGGAALLTGGTSSRLLSLRFGGPGTATIGGRPATPSGPGRAKHTLTVRD